MCNVNMSKVHLAQMCLPIYLLKTSSKLTSDYNACYNKVTDLTCVSETRIYWICLLIYMAHRCLTWIAFEKTRSSLDVEIHVYTCICIYLQLHVRLVLWHESKQGIPLSLVVEDIGWGGRFLCDYRKVGVLPRYLIERLPYSSVEGLPLSTTRRKPVDATYNHIHIYKHTYK